MRLRETSFSPPSAWACCAHGMNIAIIGLGYVGLPLCLQFARSGVRVLGLDIDAQKVSALNAGRSYIKHIAADEVQKFVHAGKFSASTDFARIQSGRRRGNESQVSNRNKSKTPHVLS